MNSNIKTAQDLERNLLFYYGTGIAELREYCNTLGVYLSIQANGLWISRPGYSKAAQITMPSEEIDWKTGQIHQHIRILADELWSENHPKPALLSTPS